MQHELKAPRVHYYVECYGQRGLGSLNSSSTYDDLSYQKIDELFDIMNRLKPVSDRGLRKIWVPVDRGTIEDFGNYEEMLADGDVETYEQFERWWRSECPDETEWVLVETLDDTEIHYRAVFVSQKLVLEVDPRKERCENLAVDMHEFTCWLVEATEQAVRKVMNGTYDEEINARLPAKHRTGTMLRKDMWALWPDEKEWFFQDLPQEDVDYFLEHACDERETITDRLKSLTANDFYGFCAMGYKANNYPDIEKTPKEQYSRHADGRDEGLSKIDPDSPEAFADWFHDPQRYGGHPWEVCRGGNSTHIDLRVWEDEVGYLLWTAGSAVGRCVEAIKFFNTLHRAGVPVIISDAEMLKRRLLGTELIGIVPDGIIPTYCGAHFKERVIDYMNLPYEDTDEFVKRISWYPIEEVRLKTEA